MFLMPSRIILTKDEQQLTRGRENYKEKKTRNEMTKKKKGANDRARDRL